MTPFRWILLWAAAFTFGPIIIGRCDFFWYLGGTIMGAVLFIGFAVLDGR